MSIHFAGDWIGIASLIRSSKLSRHRWRRFASPQVERLGPGRYFPDMLVIQGKAIGRRKPLFEGFSVPPPDDLGEGGPLKLRDLIAHVVIEEVAAFQKRQTARRLDRVLSSVQIVHGESRGKISPEGRPPDAPPPKRVDIAAAVQTALEGFTDGLYLVIIDEVEYRELDDIVHLKKDSSLTFIRLTFLAGA